MPWFEIHDLCLIKKDSQEVDGLLAVINTDDNRNKKKKLPYLVFMWALDIKKDHFT